MIEISGGISQCSVGLITRGIYKFSFWHLMSSPKLEEIKSFSRDCSLQSFREAPKTHCAEQFISESETMRDQMLITLCLCPPLKGSLYRSAPGLPAVVVHAHSLDMQHISHKGNMVFKSFTDSENHIKWLQVVRIRGALTLLILTYGWKKINEDEWG